MESERLAIKGRGRLRATATADEGGLTIRIDDDGRPDFWAEVRLTRMHLAELVNRIDLAELDAADAARPVPTGHSSAMGWRAAQ